MEVESITMMFREREKLFGQFFVPPALDINEQNSGIYISPIPRDSERILALRVTHLRHRRTVRGCSEDMAAKL